MKDPVSEIAVVTNVLLIFGFQERVFFQVQIIRNVAIHLNRSPSALSARIWETAQGVHCFSDRKSPAF